MSCLAKEKMQYRAQAPARDIKRLKVTELLSKCLKMPNGILY